MSTHTAPDAGATGAWKVGTEEGGGARIADLLARMHGGDRLAAGEFLERYGSRIRRRVRGKLKPAMRRIYDSQEILSTLGRRLDLYVLAGRVSAVNEEQLWTLVFTMAQNAVVDKARAFKRLTSVEAEDSPFAAALLGRLRDAEREADAEVELDRVLGSAGDPIDRQILSLWLMGTPHATTASVLGLTAAAVRKRWERLRDEIRSIIEGERAA